MSRGYVYFVRPVGQSGPIKIGFSVHPTRRLESLMSWSPTPLEIVVTIDGSLDLEKNIHDCFADLLSHREWFRADDRLTALIEKLVAGVPIGDAMDLSARVSTISKKAAHWAKHPDNRRRAIYSHRVNWAVRKAAQARGVQVGVCPKIIEDILARWRGRGRNISCNPTPPTEGELALLDQFIANADPFMFPEAQAA